MVILSGHNLWLGCQSRLKTPITDWIMAITHQLSTQYFCRTRKGVDKTIFFLNSKHLKVSHESVFQIWTTNVGANFPISKKTIWTDQFEEVLRLQIIISIFYIIYIYELSHAPVPGRNNICNWLLIFLIKVQALSNYQYKPFSADILLEKSEDM